MGTASPAAMKPAVGFCIRISRDLLDFLSGYQKQNGVSRIAALYSLILKTRPFLGRIPLDECPPDSSKMGDAFIHVQHLADEFNWSINTVKDFLDTLESLGVMSKTKVGKGHILSFYNLKFFNSNNSN